MEMGKINFSESARKTRKVAPDGIEFVRARLKRDIRRHLRSLGFKKNTRGELLPPSKSKDAIRALHSSQRAELLEREEKFIAAAWPKLKDYFASGAEINPPAISPFLEIVSKGTKEADLFRLASLLWSIPVSYGYGRRLRFLVWDKAHSKLMGLIALGDPVFNLRVRDSWIGWTSRQRKGKLVNLLDAYVLGAIPPYNLLLCGKVVASLVCTSDIRDAFTRKYASSKGSISEKYKRPKLCLVTTSSALGRSSVYNRLKLDGRTIFGAIGFTEGWGHFHISESLFDQMRRFLKLKRDGYSKNYRYGDGPNWKLRAVRRAFELLGMNPDLLRHGIQREVFVSKIAANAQSLLVGKAKRVRYVELKTAAEVGHRAVLRWVVPRAIAREDYKAWTLDMTRALLGARPAPQSKAVAEKQSTTTASSMR